MAVLTGSTVSSSVDESIPAETIERALQLAPLPPAVFIPVAWAGVVAPGSGVNVRLLQEDSETVPSGGKTEGDEFTLVEYTLSERSVTPNVVGYGRFISDESVNDSQIDVVQATTNKAVRFIFNRIDVDGLALLTSLTTSESATGVATTEDHIQNAVAKFQALNKDGSACALILNHIQLRDLNKDIRSSGGAFLGGDAASAEVRQLLGPNTGFKGVYCGMSVFVSPNVGKSSNDAIGGIVPMGEFGPLAIRSWEPLKVAQQYQPLRHGNLVAYSVRYGVAVANLLNGVKIITNGT